MLPPQQSPLRNRDEQPKLMIPGEAPGSSVGALVCSDGSCVYMLTIVVDSEHCLYGHGILFEGKYDYGEWKV